MPDAPSQPLPTFDTSVSRRRFKRKANRNTNMADLAAVAEAGLEDKEDNGSSTTPEATPMISPPQSKARYKRVATKPAPNIGALEDKQRKRTRLHLSQPYTWTLGPAVSSHEGTPMVADLLQHSWAQNRQCKKDKE
ncbi:hypothetical protein V6N13_109820 [Hibiscus sabdariffa]